jgi:hypothetical protein
MTRDIRGQYAQHLEEMRRPLTRLFGSRDKPVDPIVAMDRLAEAARDGNMSVLRPFMRVTTEKGAASGMPERSVATLIQHMAGPSVSLTGYLGAMRELTPEVRSVLFQSAGGRIMRRDLERLERALPRLAAFERSTTPAADMRDNIVRIAANRTNLATGLWVMANWPTALIAAGGAHAMARFMASPAYVRWLTRADAVRTTSGVRDHLSRLSTISGNDAEFGIPIDQAIGMMMDAVAVEPAGNAATQRKGTRHD